MHSPSEPSPALERPRTDWVRWRSEFYASRDTKAWRVTFQRRLFLYHSCLGFGALTVISIRNAVLGVPYETDIANALIFGLAFGIVLKRPRWTQVMGWVVLIAMYLNAMDGAVDGWMPAAFVLLPLLVAYAAILGDLWLSLAALGGVLGAYGVFASFHWPLPLDRIITISNLSISAVLLWLVSFGNWLMHRKDSDELASQGQDLEKELDLRTRLNAILFHDIRNPLSAILSCVQLARMDPSDHDRYLGKIDELAMRINAIIDSARDLATEYTAELSDTSVGELYKQLVQIFAMALQSKALHFVLGEGAQLHIRTDTQILCNSVFSNLLSNAIKFSAPGGTITMMATSLPHDAVRIEIRDQGQGFPPAIFKAAVSGHPYASTKGTGGEVGSAYGLRIAAICLRRLHGHLELRNDGEGAAVSVLLPEAKSGDGISK